jgi:chemotaxis protein CheX
MYAEELEQIVQTVFATMFEMELVRQDGVIASESAPLLATVQITGAWTGSVVLALSSELIRTAASKMLNCNAREITTEDQQEVASELANMIGGNLKSILPAPSILSIPTIASSHKPDSAITHGDLDLELSFTDMVGNLLVGVYSRN